MAKRQGLALLDDVLEGPLGFWESLVRYALRAGAKPEAAEDILKSVDWMRRRKQLKDSSQMHTLSLSCSRFVRKPKTSRITAKEAQVG